MDDAKSSPEVPSDSKSSSNCVIVRGITKKKADEVVFPECHSTQGPRGARLTAVVHGSEPKLLKVSDEGAEPCRGHVSAAWNELDTQWY